MSEYRIFDDEWPEKSLPLLFVKNGLTYVHYTNVIETSNPSHANLWYALAHCGIGMMMVRSVAEPATQSPIDIMQFYLPEPTTGSDITPDDLAAFMTHLFARYPALFGPKYSTDLPQQDLDELVANEAILLGIISSTVDS